MAFRKRELSMSCRLFSRGVLLGVAVLTSLASQTVSAQDPAFGFLYGYSLGQARNFRTNIPTPPYFAIHPPVYYGERFARPYGDSPFASWPTLQVNPAYRPEPKQNVNQSIENPYCGTPEVNTQIHSERDFTMGKKKTILNPFVIDITEGQIANK